MNIVAIYRSHKGTSTLTSILNAEIDSRLSTVKLDIKPMYKAALLNKKIKFLIYVNGCFVSMRVCAPWASLLSRGQKRPSDPLRLKLQLVVIHHVDAGS